MEAWTTIRYLHAQGMGIRAICREVGVSRKAVRRALRLDGTPRYSRPQRPNPKLVPFEAEIRRLYFTEHLIGSRILREVRPAYTGSASALYTYLKGLRASVPSSKATERFETPPGFQAQFDWSPYTSTSAANSSASSCSVWCSVTHGASTTPPAWMRRRPRSSRRSRVACAILARRPNNC